MKKIFRYFLQGLLYVAPLGITLYVVYLIFSFTNNFLTSFVSNFMEKPIPGMNLLVLVITFFILALVGFIGRSLFAKPFVFFFDRVIKKVPLINMIYSSIRDLLSAFVGHEKKFNQPVLVKVNTISNLEKLGFITQSDLDHLNIKNKVAVYFPHSYNFSGELFIVPTEHLTLLDIPASEVMKFVVSGGVTRI